MPMIWTIHFVDRRDSIVCINDPDGGVKKTGTVSWFNQKMMNHVDGCFMYEDPQAY